MELLPLLADRLGVQIDALFGRETGEGGNINQALKGWLASLPAQTRMRELFALLSQVYLSIQVPKYMENMTEPWLTNSCYLTEGVGEESEWLRSKMVTEEGAALAVWSWDFPLFLLLPEPEGGYAANLGDNGDYRNLFSAFSLPGSLELLRYLYAQPSRYYSAAALSKRVVLPREEASQALEAMVSCHLLNREELELEEGREVVYQVRDMAALVPFLYFARWITTKHEAWIHGWSIRQRPWLRERGADHGAET